MSGLLGKYIFRLSFCARRHFFRARIIVELHIQVREKILLSLRRRARRLVAWYLRQDGQQDQTNRK